MSMPRKTLKKETAIRSAASKAPTGPGNLAGNVGNRAAKHIGKAIGGKGRSKGPVYDPPKPVRPRTVKK